MNVKTIFLLMMLSSFLFSKDVTFLEAWQKVLEKSDSLKAKKEDLLSAKFRQKAARDLYLPDISISAVYTHLQKDVKLSGKSLIEDSNDSSLTTIMEGIVKGSSGAVFSNAIQSGKSVLEAKQMAQKNASDILKAVSNLQNKSFMIKEQDFLTSSIKAVYPLYTGGKRKAAQIVASGEIDEALAVLELAKLEQFENLAKVYFGVVLLEDVFNTKKEALKTFKKHYEEALKLEKYGQIAKIERLSAQVNFDKAKIEANKTQKKLEISKIALAQMLHEQKVEPSTKLFIDKNIGKLDVYKEKTLNSYPVFSMLKAKKKKIQALVLSKKSSYRPNVFLFGDYSIYKEKTPMAKNAPDWFVGAGISYKIFDNKGREGQLKASYTMKNKIEHMEKQTIRDVSVLLEKTYKEVLLALEEYKGLSSSITLAYENLRLTEKSFSQGLSTSMRVVDAELFLQSVKTQRALASYNYILAFTKLLALSNQIDKFKKYK